jgi:hypothetical protein
MTFFKVPSILLAVCFLLSPLAVSAQVIPDHERAWTTVGSAGTLDETSEGKVFFNRGVVQKGNTLVISGRSRIEGGVEETDSAVIRYNVTAVDGMAQGSLIAMQIRFLDHGASARVVAQLIEVDIDSGPEATLLTFDSNTVTPKDGYRSVEVVECSKSPFDFTRKAYYIEATLTTSTFVIPSAAGIEVIQIETSICI